MLNAEDNEPENGNPPGWEHCELVALGATWTGEETPLFNSDNQMKSGRGKGKKKTRPKEGRPGRRLRRQPPGAGGAR